MKLILLVALLFSIASASAEEYLVRFKTPESFEIFMDSTFDRLHSMKSLSNCRISKSFSFGSFRGVTIDVSKDVMRKIKKNPMVADVVPNLQFNAFDDVNAFEYDYEVDDGDDMIYYAYATKLQHDAPRHLSRLSRRSQLPYDLEDEDDNTANFNYYYDKRHKGRNVNAYIIDTGIYKEHNDFQGRAIFGEDLTGEGPGDANGHGTHVAGIVGSKSFGVAKEITLVEVKALNAKGQGNLTTVISALEFSVNHCRASGQKGCVVNLSLGAIRNSVINQAVKAAHEAGLVIVVAAGNSNINACWNSPASAPEAITVGAFDDRTDTIAKFSNWGSCVDIFAPGVKVRSLSNAPPYNPIVFSGTSMASPSISGLAAILLDGGVDFTNIKECIMDLSTPNVFQRRTLFFKPGTPNRVAFNGVDKLDDEFDGAVYPIVDVDSLLEELKNYQPDLQQLKSIADGGFNLINYNDDRPLPVGQINLRKRALLSPIVTEDKTEMASSTKA